MSRMSELAEQAAIVDSIREPSAPMSKEALLMKLGFMAAELRRLVIHDPACLSHAQEAQLQTIRMDLESVARIGGECEAYIDGTERAPMPSLMQAAE